MRMETPGGTYRVIRVNKRELSLCSYLAVDSGQIKKESGGQCYLLLEFQNPALAKDIMMMFMEMKTEKQKNPFPDFVDCFLKEKTVWAVLRYHEGIPFREAAERAASRKERAALWEGLLERLFFHKIPPYLRYEAAAPANIVVDQTSAVWVNYELYETDRLHEQLFVELQKRLYESFRMLFESDWKSCGKKNTSGSAEGNFEDGLARYAEKLAEGSFEDEAALYREFHKLNTQISESEEERGADGGGLLRLLRWVLWHTDVIGKCGYWVLVLALWGLFFWLCFRPKTAPEERERITVIGTVEVGEQEQMQE
ncbi:MAG: hypothetical protein K2N41_10145 [Lachnospiraceae bacterium]|nr:hypothetical protein [Lachnospiraceae bacterium]MDE7240052.1 hypothetical protein [Lachnospiraceae bacterium]